MLIELGHCQAGRSDEPKLTPISSGRPSGWHNGDGDSRVPWAVSQAHHTRRTLLMVLIYLMQLSVFPPA